jgi:hypothetical protein
MLCYCYTTFKQLQEKNMKKKKEIKRVQIVMPPFLDEALQELATIKMVSKGAIVRELILKEAKNIGVFL